MIRTLGELLEKLRLAEAEKLDAEQITHPPTIGAMYEGLTRSILDMAIPAHLDLRIVTGFVIDGKGGRSGQIDCMLARGEGRPIPYVDGSYEWHVKDVLAVLEVKKSLFADDLADAYDQLKSATDITSSWLQGASGPAEFSLSASMRTYAQCVGEILPPSDEWRTMDPARHLIWHTIMTDQIAPLRIMLGYGGYSTEGGLRRGYINFLTDKLQTLGYGPPSMPNLIVANGVSLVKLSGHPYSHPVLSDGWWPLVASSTVNPTLLILEHLWTRISYLHPAPELFGEDLETEKLSPLIEAKPVEVDSGSGRWGWQFKEQKRSAKELAEGPIQGEWEPATLDDEQNIVLHRLCSEDIDTTDPDLLAFLADRGREPQEFIASLVKTTLVAREGTMLVPTTVQCEIVLLPDGRFVAGENNTGRLSRWVNRFMERWHAFNAPN
jgi:hypothetical protein